MPAQGNYTLSEEAVAYLEGRVRDSAKKCLDASVGNARTIADIYAGRDWISAVESHVPEQGMPINEWYNSLRNNKAWTPPMTMANLLQSRLRLVTAPLNPGVPTIHVKPEVLGAVRASEAQQEIFKAVLPQSGMEDAMRDFSQSAMMSPYAGIRVWASYEGPIHRRFRVERVSCHNCGWEPHGRRFTWHRYLRTFENLDSKHQAALRKQQKAAGNDAPKPWDDVEVVEVYHQGFKGGHNKLDAAGGCPVSTWLRICDAPQSEDATELSMGTYVGTSVVARCPIVIASFLEPAEHEDVPPAEVASWLPPLRGLVQALVQINREVRTNNNVILYDDNIEAEHIDALQDSPSSATVYIPIATDEHGVAQKMRPMEKSNNIQELLVAHNVFLNMFNEVLGVTPSNMGIAEHPRKSATEAQAIDRNSNVRTADRLKVIASLWQEVAQVMMANQRAVLGETFEIVVNDRVSQTYEVPTLTEAQMTLRVDPVELGHLSKENEADQLLGWVTIFSNAFLQFRGSLPRIVRESLRRVARLMGIENVDAYLDAPVIEEGPQDRYIKLLETGQPLPVLEQDDHVLYISYYSSLVDQALQSDNPLSTPIAPLRDAIQEHQRLLDRAQRGQNFAQGPGTAPSIVPGLDPMGQQTTAGDSLFPMEGSPILSPQ